MDGSIQNSDLADGSVTTTKLNQSGCISGQLMQWDGSGWSCGNPAAIVESDPLSIHNQDTLQAGTTFYVSSGTVNNLNVNNSLKVTGMESSGQYIAIFNSGSKLAAWLRNK